MDTPAAKAVFNVDLYVSSRTFFGGTKGLKTKGEMKFLPGVKTCSSGMLCINALYSFLAGSITRKGM